MISHPEFSRPLKVDRVPAEGCTEEIAADPDELAALAKRFGLPALLSLKARIEAQPVSGRGMKLNAHIRAGVEQTCVITVDTFHSTIEIETQRIYVPPGSEAASEVDDKVDVIHGGSIDLGEFVAEELGLSLDPYPRKPGVAFHGDSEIRTAASSPFGGLAQLKSRR
jgi:uncharacterized metal-binding protein YceD (DUF177 family)